MKRIKVLIVDDSALVRDSLSEILSSDPGIEVIGTALDPIIAAKKINKETPDVITLDIEMPRMDGLTFLKKLMSQKPIPVVICSSMTEEGSDTAIKALELGAVEVLTKPQLGKKQFFEESKIKIIDVVKSASMVKVKPKTTSIIDVKPKLTADVILSKPKVSSVIRKTEKVILVGASTGGTEALRILLENFPVDCPGTVVVQHMPEFFTNSFANRLNDICEVSVKEAEHGDAVQRGLVLIAPGGSKHTLLKRNSDHYFVEIKEGPLVSRHRPSVDVLFRSAARYAGANAIGIILTGMGDDGAKGMLELRDTGAYTIAQDEKSCVIYGMPKEAARLGGVADIVALNQIHNKLRAKKIF
ncbi:MAG: chemotaxis response regulator protein-glutamate methylesterase [Ignavibacteria bacterium]|jgi:two-component system chemotaxis response regulator CheB